MKSKGFTLIELLAVIVILAIIALIATPIVLNIIKDSKENAQLRSAEFYLDAVEYTIANSILDNNPMIDGIYDVLENGDLCSEYDENKKCLNERNIELDGEKPQGGYVIIDKGQITESRMSYEGTAVLYLEDGSLFISNYDIGDEVVFPCPEYQDRTWNVISETEDTLTLMLNENLTEGYWISENDWKTYNRDNTKISTGLNCHIDEGPITVFNFINRNGQYFELDPIKNFTYINETDSAMVNYQKIEIKDGVTTITDSGGVGETLEGKTVARLITLEEVIKIAQIQNPYYREINSEYLLGTYFKQDGITMPVKDYIYDLYKNYINAGVKLDKEYYLLIVIYNYLYELYDSEYAYLPNWLGSGMIHDGDKTGYYMLTSNDSLKEPYVYYVSLTGENKPILNMINLRNNSSLGIRPVIEISKSKLN